MYYKPHHLLLVSRHIITARRLIVVLLLIAVYFLSSYALTEYREFKTAKLQAEPSSTVSSEPSMLTVEPVNQTSGGFDMKQVLDSINKTRVSAGLELLNLSELLNKAALARAEDMASKNYYDNSAYSPGTFISNTGYQYRAYGIASRIYEADNGMRFQRPISSSSSSAILSGGSASGNATKIATNWLLSLNSFLNNPRFNEAGISVFNAADGRTILVAYLASPKTSQPVNSGLAKNRYNQQQHAQQRSRQQPAYESSIWPRYIGSNITPPNIPDISAPSVSVPDFSTEPISVPASPKYEPGDAYRIARSNCARFNGSSAYEQCIQAYLRMFGY